MRKSVIIAVLLAVGAFAWIVSGQFDNGERKANAVTEQPDQQVQKALTAVRVQRLTPATRPRSIVVNGRAEASRTVQLRAEIPGAIVEVGATEGAPVAKGQVIAKIATEDRKARLSEARALLRQRQIEYKAARQLAKKGFRSSTKVAEANAYLDAARAQVRRMQVAMSHTVIKAPFDGVLENRAVEMGAYVKEGDNVAKLVDLDPALIVAHVSERDISRIKIGQVGTATLVNGQTVEGKIRYVAAVADPATRSFKVELEVANPDGRVRDGVTAELSLPLEPINAYRVSPAVLTLGDDGRIGVKIVDQEDRVRFVAIQILADESDGVWIGGLPSDPRLIMVGHEYVKAGQRVQPMPMTKGAAS